MEQNLISVLMADDHTLFRKGMSLLVNSFENVGSVKDVENGQKVIEELNQKHYDILLLDLEMPVMDGWETAKQVVKNFSDTSVIMVSMHDSLKVISDFIEIGVEGYLLKGSNPSEVKKAIKSVVNNDFYYNKIVAQALHQKIQSGEKSGKPNLGKGKSLLTGREIEVLELICHELTMKEIGDKLCISEQTIQTHRKHLMKKTGSKNAVGLVRYAIQNDLVSF